MDHIDKETLEEDFHNPKDENRIKYLRGKLWEENLKKKVVAGGGTYKNYYMKDSRCLCQIPLDHPFIARFYISERYGWYKAHKKLSNKKVRKYCSPLSNGGEYKKIHDFHL